MSLTRAALRTRGEAVMMQGESNRAVARLRSWGLVLSMALLLHLGPLLGGSSSSAGSIAFLIAGPSPVVVSQGVTFAVGGTGTCGRLTLAFGDGTSTTLSGDFPLVARHAYSLQGTFTVTATGTLNCAGSARTSVDVVRVLSFLAPSAPCTPESVAPCGSPGSPPPPSSSPSACRATGP